MNYSLRDFMIKKNHSVAFLKLISAELRDKNKELSNMFEKLAMRKQEYETLCLKIISSIEDYRFEFKDIISRAYYDKDTLDNLDFSDEHESLAYLNEVLNNEEMYLKNGSELLNNYIKYNYNTKINS